MIFPWRTTISIVFMHNNWWPFTQKCKNAVEFPPPGRYFHSARPSIRWKMYFYEKFGPRWEISLIEKLFDLKLFRSTVRTHWHTKSNRNALDVLKFKEKITTFFAHFFANWKYWLSHGFFSTSWYILNVSVMMPHHGPWPSQIIKRIFVEIWRLLRDNCQLKSIEIMWLPLMRGIKICQSQNKYVPTGKLMIQLAQLNHSFLFNYDLLLECYKSYKQKPPCTWILPTWTRHLPRLLHDEDAVWREKKTRKISSSNTRHSEVKNPWFRFSTHVGSLSDLRPWMWQIEWKSLCIVLRNWGV